MGWNCSAHFISQWAGIDPPIFHFAMDQHAILASADMDRPFVAASDFIAAPRASPKCKSILITLNLVEMLCFNEPIAHNLPPLLPPHPLPLAFLYRPPKQPTPAAAAAAAARAAKVAAVACHYYGPGVVTAAGTGVATLRRLAPTCPAAEPLPARRRGRRARISPLLEAQI